MRSFVPASTRCVRSGSTLRGRSTPESAAPSAWKPTSSWPAILSLLLVMGGPFFVAPTSGDTKRVLAHAPDAPSWRRVDAGSTTASTRGHGWRGRGRRSAGPGQMTNRGQRVLEGHSDATSERAELVARASTGTRPPRSRRPPRACASTRARMRRRAGRGPPSFAPASTRARMRARHASPPASSEARRCTQRRCNGGRVLPVWGLRGPQVASNAAKTLVDGLCPCSRVGFALLSIAGPRLGPEKRPLTIFWLRLSVAPSCPRSRPCGQRLSSSLAADRRRVGVMPSVCAPRSTCRPRHRAVAAASEGRA